MKAEFTTELSKLSGRVCWGIIAGEGNGSMVTLHIGDKIRRDRPRVALAPQVREFQGEYCLFIQGCAWRIIAHEEVIGGWSEPEPRIRELMEGLQGSRINAVQCRGPALDLCIQFGETFVLELFCDRMSVEEGLNNYSLRTPVGWFIVGARSQLRRSPTDVR